MTYVVQLFIDESMKFRLGYKSIERAREAFTTVAETMEEPNPAMPIIPVIFEDDYGTKIIVNKKIEAVSMIDPVEEAELNIELSLNTSRAQSKLEERSRRDPVLNRSQLLNTVRQPVGKA